MTRKQLRKKYTANLDRINKIQNQNTELAIKMYELCDEEQRFEEKEEVWERGRGKNKTTETRIVGRIYWEQYFGDQDSPGNGVWVERSRIVKQDGMWQI